MVRVRYGYLVRADVKINWTGGNDVLNIRGGTDDMERRV
jgi:hypothetical protein